MGNSWLVGTEKTMFDKGGLEEQTAEQFDLYLQVNEVQRIYEGLDRIRQKPVSEKQKIMSDHDGFLDDLQAEIMARLSETLGEITLEGESLGLMTEYVTSVRDLVNIIQELRSMESVDKKVVIG